MLVLEVINQVIIPNVKVLQELDSNPGSVSKALKRVLDTSVRHLVENPTWLQELSTKQTFYWGLVTSCCSKVKVVADHLEWISKYRYIIIQMSKIFTLCLDCKEKSEDWNTNLPSEDIKLVISEFPINCCSKYQCLP